MFYEYLVNIYKYIHNDTDDYIVIVRNNKLINLHHKLNILYPFTSIIYIIYPEKKYTIEFNRSKKLSTKQYDWRFFFNFFTDNIPITECTLNSVQQDFNLIHTFTISDLFHILYSINNNIFDINNG